MSYESWRISFQSSESAAKAAYAEWQAAIAHQNQEAVPIYQIYLEAENWVDRTKEESDKFPDWVTKRTVYLAPPQPQSVADALEAAANICDELEYNNNRFDSAGCGDAIRALIK